MDRPTRTIASVTIGVLTTVGWFLFLTPSGCNDGGGTTSWERCTSWLGTPAFSVEDFGLDATLNVIPPILMGLAVGLVARWLLGLTGRTPRTTGRDNSRP